MKQPDQRELVMKVTQLTLLDEQSLKELKQTQYVVIQVQELKNDHVLPEKKQAIVCLKSSDMKVKGELFDDYLGHHFVGCTVIKEGREYDTKLQIPVFKLSTNIQEYLNNKIIPIVNALDQKRRNYYAN